MSVVWWSVTLLVFTNVALAAAVFLLRLGSERRDRRDAAIDQRWQPRLFSLIAGDIAPGILADEVEQAGVSSGELDHLLDLCGRFAQRLAGDDLGLIEDFASRFAWRLARTLREGDVEARAEAVMLLSAVGGHRYEHALKSALDDPDPLVAMVAARAVARHGLVGEVPRLIERVSALGVWSPAFVAEVVAAAGISAATPLIEVLESKGRPIAERSTAALALARLHDPRAADAAAGVLAGGVVSRELVTGCLRILEVVGRPAHLGPIRRLMEHRDFAVRARAVAALGAMGTAADADRLGDLVADPSRWVALNAAVALRRLHRDDLLHGLAQRSDPAAAIAAEALQLEVVS